MNFLSQNGALVGAGIGGLFPLLANLFGGSANLGNFQGTGLSAGDVAAVSPNPQQSIDAYNAQNNANGGLFGKLSGLLGGGSNGSTNTNNSNNNNNNLIGNLGSLMGSTHTTTPGGTQPVQPLVPQQPNYGGTGPNAALAQVLNPLAGLSANGSPLGPAANNPFIAMMLHRLGS